LAAVSTGFAVPIAGFDRGGARNIVAAGRFSPGLLDDKMSRILRA
jgi:hypothetical protein